MNKINKKSRWESEKKSSLKAAACDKNTFYYSSFIICAIWLLCGVEMIQWTFIDNLI